MTSAKRFVSTAKKPPNRGSEHLVIFCAPKDLEQTQALCATLRSHVSHSAPLLCCAGRYVYPLIEQLLDNAVQSMIMMPFDARELRQKLDEFVVDHLGLTTPPPDMSEWRQMVERIRSPSGGPVRIGVVGKYTELVDSYKSIQEALIHGGIS